jgi:hypothetical protein
VKREKDSAASRAAFLDFSRRIFASYFSGPIFRE